MIDGESVLAVVPARGGSSGIPKKNLERIGGRSLVERAIDVADVTPAIDRTVVSTDSDEIARVARIAGAEIHDRPPRLARDDSLVIDTLRHVLDEFTAGGPPTYLVMLEPTCPFRSTDDVSRCLGVLAEGYDSVATFRPAEVNPHRTWRVDDGTPEPFVRDADPWLPRQALPEAYQLNGGAYAFRAAEIPETGHSLLFGETGAVVMPEERSLDIDTELDLELARLLVAKGTLSADEHE